MQLASSLAIGAAGGAAAFSFFGNPDRPVEDRLAMGAMVGAGIGAVAGTEAGRRGVLLAGEGAVAAAKFGAKRYWRSAASTYAGLRSGGVGEFNAALHAYGTRGAFAAAGAVFGAEAAGPDHRTRGAAIGAAAGFGLRSAVAGVEMYSNMARVGGKNGVRVLSVAHHRLPVPGVPLAIAGLAALAFGAGVAMRNDDAVTQAAYNPVGGYDEYPDGGAPDSGIRERMRAIGANGDVALGAHRARHG